MLIMMYHRVADDGPAGLARWRVSPPEFERQMAYLASEGFRTFPFSQWSAGGDRQIVLTFDDAYLDFITTALPVLKRHGFVATMFVPTGLVGGHAAWDVGFGPPAPLMSWDQIAEIASAGIELGAHTVTHPRLPTLAAEDARREILQSKAVLEAKSGRAVTTFAYPYGDHDETTRNAVAEAGMPLAVTITQEPWTDLSLPRVEVSGFDDMAAFARKVATG